MGFIIIMLINVFCRTPKTQEKIARYCKEIFGDALLTDPLDSYPVSPVHLFCTNNEADSIIFLHVHVYNFFLYADH